MSRELESLGHFPAVEESLSDEERRTCELARVIEEHKRYYTVARAGGDLLTELAGKLRHEARTRADLPAVGDWVLVAPTPGGRGRIERVLPRRTKLSRKAAGAENEEQILATNVDVAFIVVGLDAELNARRLERYLATAYGGGVLPVVVLTKLDLHPDVAAVHAEIAALAPGVDIHAVSAASGEGIENLRRHLGVAKTAVLLGPSGAGKSTLINRLAGGELRATGEVREADRKGRHTTTSRTLVRLPDGALVIDTPGIRELEVWGAETGIEQTFEDVEALAAGCRFRDCAHEAEPGCEVRRALQAGELPADRYEAFQKLRAEERAQVARVETRAREERTRREKVATRALRARLEDKGRR